MVLLSELLFFASIPCYALRQLGGPPTIPIRMHNKIEESIEAKVKQFRSENDQVKMLKILLYNERVKNMENPDTAPDIKTLLETAIGAAEAAIQKGIRQTEEKWANKTRESERRINELERWHEIMIDPFRACLTCQALAYMEMDAFPYFLYNDENLPLNTKWMLALAMFRTPILNRIRFELAKENLTYTRFILAVRRLRSSISTKFVEPRLREYRLPQTKRNIKTFCSFVKKLKNSTSSEEQQTEWTNTEHEIDTAALEFACECAIAFNEGLFDAKQEEELRKDPCEQFSAAIIIQNVTTQDENTARDFLKMLLENDEYKGNVGLKQTAILSIFMQDFRGPEVEKRPKYFDLAFHLVCKSALSITTHAPRETLINLGEMIQQDFIKKFSKSKKSVVLLLGSTGYFLDGSET